MNPAAFTPDERAAIDAALAQGRLTRIENGHWPDAERLECWRRFDIQAGRKKTSPRASKPNSSGA